MTLILTLGSQDYVLFLADRRLSSVGRPVDEEAGKAAILTCADGRFGYAFSGLADAQGFQAYKWMLRTLADIGRTEFGATVVVRGLRDKLDEKFASKQMIQLSRAARRLSVVFGGYIYERADRPILAWAVLSNFRDPKTAVESALAEPTFRAGFGHAAAAQPAPPGCLSRTRWASPEAMGEKKLIAAMLRRIRSSIVSGASLGYIGFVMRPESSGPAKSDSQVHPCLGALLEQLPPSFTLRVRSILDLVPHR
jgi:hypothetical protein